MHFSDSDTGRDSRVTRKLQSSFADMNLEQTRAFQLQYLDWKTAAESVKGNWIADRSFVDIAAVWFERDAKENLQLQSEVVEPCRSLCSNYSCLIYLPYGVIEFEDNGIRQTARTISALLNEWRLPHFTLKSSTIEDRVKEVIRNFENLGFIVPV